MPLCEKKSHGRDREDWQLECLLSVPECGTLGESTESEKRLHFYSHIVTLYVKPQRSIPAKDSPNFHSCLSNSHPVLSRLMLGM